MSEWQPIETAPKDGTLFLAALVFDSDGQDGGLMIIRWRDDWRAWTTHPVSLRLSDTGDEDDDRSPTHWMPLPEPPR